MRTVAWVAAIVCAVVALLALMVHNTTGAVIFALDAVIFEYVHQKLSP